MYSHQPYATYTNDQPINSGTRSFIYADDLCIKAPYQSFKQLGPHNTKHKHPNQSAKHHTTTNIITRHHRCLTHFRTGHRGQLNTHYHQTTYPSPPQLTYDKTTNYGPLPTTRNQTGHNLQKTQSPLSLRPPYPPTYTLPT